LFKHLSDHEKGQINAQRKDEEPISEITRNLGRQPFVIRYYMKKKSILHQKEDRINITAHSRTKRRIFNNILGKSINKITEDLQIRESKSVGH